PWPIMRSSGHDRMRPRRTAKASKLRLEIRITPAEGSGAVVVGVGVGGGGGGGGGPTAEKSMLSNVNWLQSEGPQPNGSVVAAVTVEKKSSSSTPVKSKLK